MRILLRFGESNGVFERNLERRGKAQRSHSENRPLILLGTLIGEASHSCERSNKFIRLQCSDIILKSVWYKKKAVALHMTNNLKFYFR